MSGVALAGTARERLAGELGWSLLVVAILTAIVASIRLWQCRLDAKASRRAQFVATASFNHRLRTLSERRKIFRAMPLDSAQPDHGPLHSTSDCGTVSVDGAFCSPPSSPRGAHGLSRSTSAEEQECFSDSDLPIQTSTLRRFLLQRRPTLGPVELHRAASGSPPSHSEAGDSDSGWERQTSAEALQPSRVLGAVPLHTLVTTREVLSTFGYDLHALQRMEAAVARQGHLGYRNA